jgi:tetratricopeptide (TPR) repeat protein
MTAAADLLNQGLRSHQAGDLVAAEDAYRRLLALQPNDVNANQLIGVILYQRGDALHALDFLRNAQTLRPSEPAILYNLALVYQALGQKEDAVACFRQALAQRPDWPEVLVNIGALLGELGRTDEAIATYRNALALRPDLPEANNNLGNLLRNQDRLTEAIVCYRRAVAARADHVEAHVNLGSALRESGEVEAAVASYREALRHRPDYPLALRNLGNALRDLGKLDESLATLGRLGDSAEAHNDLGETLRQMGRLDEALARCRHALSLQPDFPEAYSNLGNIQRDLGKFEEATASFRRALELRRDYPEAWSNLGNVLRDLDRREEAVDAYRHALRLRSNFPDADNNLGVVLRELGRLGEAVSHFEHALRVRPDHIDAHNNVATALRELGQLEDAEAHARRALALRPDHADAHNNLGMVRAEQGHLDEAIACYRESLRLKPEFVEAHNNLGNAYSQRLEMERAFASYRDSLRVRPDYDQAHANLALGLLKTGDYVAGWAEWEWRTLGLHAKPRVLPQPRWDDSDLAGRTILLHAEQGLGDTLQFIRYAPLVKQRGAGRLIVECQSPLVSLVARCPGVDQVFAQGAPLPAFDVHAPLMSLGGILGTTLETIPTPIPYLHADPDRVAKWKAEIGGDAFKVGVAWQGSLGHKGDRWRSVPLDLFAPLADVPGVRLVSVQKGPGVEQIAAVDFRVLDVGSRRSDFADTAALLQALDLVVSIDSAVVHCAGGLGVPTWVALPFAPDWRWLLDCDDSPWYPSLRLLRQPSAGDWSTVFERLAAELWRRVHGRDPAPHEQPRLRRTMPPPVRRDTAPVCVERGNALRAQGRSNEAAVAYRQALALDPSLAEAHNNLGAVLGAEGRHLDAADCFARAIELRPEHADFHHNCGLALEHLGRLGEAIACYERTIALDPDFVNAQFRLGNVRRDQGRYAEAAEHYRHVIRVEPNHGLAQTNLGRALRDVGRLEEAIEHGRNGVALLPQSAEAHANLAIALQDAGRSEDAVAAFRESLRLFPDSAENQNYLGAALQALGRYAESVACHRRSIALKPDYVEAHHNLATALEGLGDVPAADASYGRAIALRPDCAESHWNRGLLWLRQGDLPRGWPGWEWRWRLPGWPQRTFDRPRWDRSDLRGRTILLHAEQGLGDSLQFIRYAPLIQARGGRVVVEVPPPLRRLLTHSPGIDDLVTRGEPLPPFDVEAPLTSLGGIFNTTLATIPASVPYLFADDADVERWRKELGTDGIKIGLVWQGNPGYKRDYVRSAPLAAFASLAAVPGVRLFSLQKGAGSEQLAGVSFEVVDLANRLSDFADTAAALRELDLVVTVDTAVAHCGGGLGVPTWILLPFLSDWRWLTNREDSPWYPSVRLFRQPRPGDWTSVFGQVVEAVGRLS